jgi:hypothetical protein
MTEANREEPKLNEWEKANSRGRESIRAVVCMPFFFNHYAKPNGADVQVFGKCNRFAFLLHQAQWLTRVVSAV